MGMESAITAVGQYIQKVNGLIGNASGPVNTALYVNNQDGAFAFDTDPLVKTLNAVDNDTDLGYSKTVLQSNQFMFDTWQRISRGNWQDNAPTRADVGFSDNAIPEDIAGFTYDAENDVIKSTRDTKSMVGFVSPEGHDHYVLDVTLTSTSTWQNDPLGLLLGYVRDADGTTHTLTVFRSGWDNYAGLDSAMQVAVDYNTVGSAVIANQNEGLLWVDGSPATGPAPSGTSPHAIKPWNQAPNGIRLYVTRSGNQYTIDTSNYDVPGLVPAARLTFTLDDHPTLARFKGPSPYGYVAISQDNAIWTAAQRPSQAATLVDLRTGQQHVWRNSTWVVEPGELDDALKPGRLCYCPNTQKAFYRDLDGIVRQITQ